MRRWLSKGVMPWVAHGLLIGCATSPEQCDPDIDDFFTTASCTASGAYGVRRDQQAQELAEQQAINQAFQQLAKNIEVEQQRVRGELSDHQADLAALNRSWAALQATLAQRRTENAALAAQLERMEDKVSAINLAEDVSAEQKEKMLNDLKHQAQILSEELEAGLY